MLTTKTISAARRTWRGDRNEVADHQRGGRGEQHGLPVDEMEGRQIEPLGDGRAGGQRHHDADHHQRDERAEQPAIDGAKPIGDGAAFSARNHARLPLAAFAAINAATIARKRIAARFEIGELIVGGAGRRQQHDRLGGGARARRRARRRRPRCRAFRSARTATAPSSVRRSLRSPRRSDRPCATRGSSGRSGSMPPSFALPPRIQKMSWNDSSAFSAASALVALESLTNSDAAEAADLLHAMREAGKARQRLARSPRVDRPSARAAAKAKAAFWPLCAPRNAGATRKIASRSVGCPRTTKQPSIDVDVGVSRGGAGDADDTAPAVRFEARRDRAARLVVDADQRDVRRWRPAAP